jgi:hypothetical protein
MSGRYYASDEYYDPETPSFSDYKGSAPTVTELMEKASKVEDKLFEAMCAEMDVVEGWVMSWHDREWYLDTADGDEVSEHTGGVTEAIEKGTKYDISDFQIAISSLASIGGDKIQLFNTFDTEVKNASDGLSPDVWDSEAASSFRHDFLNAYPDISETHGKLLGTLRGALEGYREALETTYKKYDEAMDAAIDACEAIIKTGSTNAKGLASTVLGASLNVAGIVYSGGGATMTFSLAGSGLSVESAALTGGGSTTDETRNNLVETINTAKSALDELDEKLSEGLGNDYDTVSGGRHNPDMKIDLPRPNFTYDGADPF